MGEKKRTNKLGKTGFTLSILALCFCWFPPLSIFLGVLAITFSVIGMFRAPRGLAFAGIIICCCDGIIISIFWTVFFAIIAAMFGIVNH